MIKGVSEETVPLLSEVTTTVTTTNAQLVRVDAITSNVQAATTNVSALTALFAATLGGPVVKVAAFTYGVRSALADRPGQRTRRKVGRPDAGQQGRRPSGEAAGSSSRDGIGRLMRRVFWVAVGAAAGVYAVRKVQKTLHAYSPSGLAERAGGVGDRCAASPTRYGRAWPTARPSCARRWAWSRPTRTRR